MMVHICSGMPARSTELTTYTIRNGASLPRTLYFDGELVLLAASYSKTNAVTGSRKVIPRFLCHESSMVLLREVLIVRPFASLAAGIVFGPDAKKTYDKFLFVKGGGRMTEEEMRSTFCHYYKKYSKIPLNFQRFRHLIKYISREL